VSPRLGRRAKAREGCSTLPLASTFRKDGLDAHRLPDGLGRRFPNSASGHRSLIPWLGEVPVERVVFESTGAHNRALERALAETGVAEAKIHPL